MRLALLFTLGLCVLVLPARAAPPPHVVTIEGRAPGSEEPVRRGLGFVSEAEGFVLTAYQNVTHPETGRLLDEISARSWDEPDAAPLPARIVGVEPNLSLAILQLETDEPLRASEVGRRQGAAIGQAIRAPTSLEPGASETALGRLTGLNAQECYQESLTATMFHAEMKLPDAVAGAPVYDAHGRIVALFTAYHPIHVEGDVDGADEVHLLPIFLAFNIYDSVKRKQSMRSPWTGFSVRPLRDAERALFPTQRGHVGGIGIEYVWENSPAEKMGIRKDDILVQLSHNVIGSVADFQKWLYLYGVGSPVKLVIVRDGREYLVADYVIEERPAWAKPR